MTDPTTAVAGACCPQCGALVDPADEPGALRCQSCDWSGGLEAARAAEGHAQWLAQMGSLAAHLRASAEAADRAKVNAEVAQQRATLAEIAATGTLDLEDAPVVTLAAAAEALAQPGAMPLRGLADHILSAWRQEDVSRMPYPACQWMRRAHPTLIAAKQEEEQKRVQEEMRQRANAAVRGRYCLARTDPHNCPEDATHCVVVRSQYTGGVGEVAWTWDSHEDRIYVATQPVPQGEVPTGFVCWCCSDTLPDADPEGTGLGFRVLCREALDRVRAQIEEEAARKEAEKAAHEVEIRAMGDALFAGRLPCAEEDAVGGQGWASNLVRTQDVIYAVGRWLVEGIKRIRGSWYDRQDPADRSVVTRVSVPAYRALRAHLAQVEERARSIAAVLGVEAETTCERGELALWTRPDDNPEEPDARYYTVNLTVKIGRVVFPYEDLILDGPR